MAENGTTIAALGVVAVAAALLVPSSPLSAVGADTGDGNTDTEVKDATLNAAATPLGSSTKVGTNLYMIVNGQTITQDLTAGQFTAIQNTFTNQDSADLFAFGSSNYPVQQTISFDGSTTVNEVVDVAEIAAAADISLELRDDGNSVSSVDVSAGDRETVDAVRVTVDKQDVYYNAGAVFVEKPSNSNVTVDMPDAEEIAVPDSAPDSVDVAFRTFSPNTGGSDFTEFAEKDSSSLVVEGDDSNDPSETLTVYVDDVQAFQSSDTGDIEFGLEDGDGNELGLADQSTTLTVN